LHYFSLCGNNETIFTYWKIFNTDELYYSYAEQNAATQITLSPLNKFLDKQHSFFEYSPEILIYSEKKNDRTEED